MFDTIYYTGNEIYNLVSSIALVLLGLVLLKRIINFGFFNFLGIIKEIIKEEVGRLNEKRN